MTPTPTKTRAALITLLALTTAVVAMPLASAMSLPLIGEVDPGLNWGFTFVVIAILAAVALMGGASIIRQIPIAGKMLAGSSAAVLVVALIAASFVNTGGLLNTADASSPATFTPSPAAATTAAGGFSIALYEPTSDVTFYAADASTKASKDATVKVFKPGVSEKAAFEGSATPEYTATMSSGKTEITGIQAQTLGCSVDVALDLANYYEKIVRNVNICREKNALGNNDISVPTIYLQAFGTISQSKTDTSLTCSAGSQCSYSLIIRNSAADKYLIAPATKFTNVANATLDSVDTGGQCEIIEVSSTQYVVFTGDQSEIGPLGTVTCPVKITYASGSADGSFKWTTDDLWMRYGSTAWNTNSNVRGATAASATTVTMA